MLVYIERPVASF